MKTSVILAAFLALVPAALRGQGHGIMPPPSSAYPLPKNDPNGLWKQTPDGFWARETAFKAVPDGAPPDLTRAQRWKWADRGLLAGTVLKVFDQGVLVRCDPPPTPPAPGAVPRVYGLFLLKNYAAPGFLAVGDAIRVVAFPTGRFKDVDGSDHRVYDTQIRDF